MHACCAPQNAQAKPTMQSLFMLPSSHHVHLVYMHMLTSQAHTDTARELPPPTHHAARLSTANTFLEGTEELEKDAAFAVLSPWTHSQVASEQPLVVFLAYGDVTSALALSANAPTHQHQRTNTQLTFEQHHRTTNLPRFSISNNMPWLMVDGKKTSTFDGVQRTVVWGGGCGEDDRQEDACVAWMSTMAIMECKHAGSNQVGGDCVGPLVYSRVEEEEEEEPLCMEVDTTMCPPPQIVAAWRVPLKLATRWKVGWAKIYSPQSLRGGIVSTFSPHFTQSS